MIVTMMECRTTSTDALMIRTRLPLEYAAAACRILTVTVMEHRTAKTNAPMIRALQSITVVRGTWTCSDEFCK